MLMGIDFFKSVIRVQKEYIKSGKEIKNNIQTNGTLITKEWIDFFVENDFKVGMSFDGVINDVTRGKTDNIFNSFRLLKGQGVPFGIVNVVNEKSISVLSENYHLYKENKIDVKFSPVFDAKNKDNRSNINLEQFILSFQLLADEWLADKNCNIHIQPFEMYINLFLNKTSCCSYSSCITKFLSIDSNADIWPCGRNYSQEYLLGNLYNYSKSMDIFNGCNYQGLIRKNICRREKCKITCQYFGYCNGGCMNDAMLENGIEENGGFSCLFFKAMFQYVIDKLSDHDKIKNPIVLKMLCQK